jgi:protein-tyrosine phosphatase
MDTSSFFITDKALFGCFPTQESVRELEENGVRYFVDLTTDEEKEHKVTMYITNYTYINYPIQDRYIPSNWKSYARLILTLNNIISSLQVNTKVFIGCRGGHGRSGVVVSSLLCYYFDMLPEESLELTKQCHANRKILKDKWRKIGSPQTYTQKKFIYKFFSPLIFYKTYKNNNSLF